VIQVECIFLVDIVWITFSSGTFLQLVQSDLFL